jgi:hypothetical protein
VVEVGTKDNQTGTQDYFTKTANFASLCRISAQACFFFTALNRNTRFRLSVLGITLKPTTLYSLVHQEKIFISSCPIPENYLSLKAEIWNKTCPDYQHFYHSAFIIQHSAF